MQDLLTLQAFHIEHLSLMQSVCTVTSQLLKYESTFHPITADHNGLNPQRPLINVF